MVWEGGQLGQLYENRMTVEEECDWFVAGIITVEAGDGVGCGEVGMFGNGSHI